MFTFTDIEAGKNDLPKFTLKSSDEAHSCDIYLYGCTVTSWVHNGIEKLFCSPTTPFNGVNAIRGGIPVVFPQFGRPDEVMPQHGFARTSTWSLERSECTDSFGTAVFTLSDDESTRAVWPHSFSLIYTVTLSASGLRTTFEATNRGDSAFNCQALLHTYIAVPKIEDVRVKGLGGLSLIDKMAPATGSELPVDDRELAVIDREVDRIYIDAGHVMHSAGDDFSLPAVDVLHQSEVLMRVQRKAYVKLSDEVETKVVRSLPTDCVLWNAWIEKTKSISDLEDDAYLRYVCVEPGICSRYEAVDPKHTLVLDQYLRT